MGGGGIIVGGVLVGYEVSGAGGGEVAVGVGWVEIL